MMGESMNQKSANIKDVAREAKCSIATVSCVLNNRGRIGKATQKRVREACKKLDYYPSAGGCSETIGLYYAPLDLSTVTPGIHGLDSENEDIRSHIVPLTQAMEWVGNGKIKSSMTIIALQWLALRKP